MLVSHSPTPVTLSPASLHMPGFILPFLHSTPCPQRLTSTDGINGQPCPLGSRWVWPIGGTGEDEAKGENGILILLHPFP